MQRLVFVRVNGGCISFAPAAWATLMSFKQIGPRSPEAGGVLLGRIISNSNDVVIDEVTVPGPRDSRGRFWFKRAVETVQARVAQAWTATQGTRIYLGEWHSHPEDDPHPSRVDRRDWQGILGKAVYEQDFLLFAIVGTRSVAIWEGNKSDRALSSLDCRESVPDVEKASDKGSLIEGR